MTLPKINLPLVALFLLLGVFFLRVDQPASISDTYFHLAVGRQVWQEKKVPYTDDFVYGSLNNQYTSTEWLSGLISYGSVQLFGLKGLLILRLIMGLFAIYFLYKALKLTPASPFITYLFITLAGFILATRLADRPEMFSFAIFAYLNFLCLDYFQNKKPQTTIILLPIIFLLWPSIHGYVALGLAFVIGWFIIILAEKFLFNKPIKRLPLFSLILIISLATCLIQYKRLFFFLLVNKIQDIPYNEFAPLINSLKPVFTLSPGQVPIEAYIYFIFVIAYLVFAFFYLKKAQENKAASMIVIYYFAILLLPFAAYRLIPFSILLSIPILYQMTSKVLSGQYQKYQIAIINLLLAILTIAILFSIINKNIAGSRTFKKVYTDPKTGKVHFVNHLWASTAPVDAPKFINTYLKTQHLFTILFWNDYFIWHSPQAKVFADVLVEYRNKTSYSDEISLTNGQGNWQNLLDQYNIDTVINTMPDSFWDNQTPVYKLPNWQLVYLNNIEAIYARKESIKTQPLDLSAIHPEMNTIIKFSKDDEPNAINQLTKLIEFDPQNAFGYEQLILYYSKKDIQKAKVLADQAKEKIPNNPQISIDTALVYSFLHQCNQAKAYVDEALIKGYNNYNISFQGDEILSNCQ